VDVLATAIAAEDGISVCSDRRLGVGATGSPWGDETAAALETALVTEGVVAKRGSVRIGYACVAVDLTAATDDRLLSGR
jgi:hypothetical protein